MTARAVDLEITKNRVYINGEEVLAADTPIDISPISNRGVLTATVTLFVNSPVINTDFNEDTL